MNSRLAAGGMAAVMLCATSASAHHPNATTRVSDSSGLGATTPGSDAVPPPNVSFSVAHDSLWFDRALTGTSAYERSPFGSVLVNLVTLQAQIQLASRTQFGARLPFGLITVLPPEEDTVTSSGLGDVELWVGQELLSLMGARTAMALTLRGGLVMPTGRYEPEVALSLTDVSPGEDGSIGVATYNAQASLGAGVWSPSLGLGLSWPLHDRISVRLGAMGLGPVTRTSDDTTWGVDFQMQAAGTFELVAERLAVTAGFEWRRHGVDESRVLDEDTGVARFEKVGGRREASVIVGVQTALHRQVTCGLQAHVPVWQEVGGVQLVEVVSGRLSCGLTLGL